MQAHRFMDATSPLATLTLPTGMDQGIESERSISGQQHEIADVSVAPAKLKASPAWQDALWRRWPREDSWPTRMDVYEAAAYLRVSPDTIRRAVVVARDGRAKLAHQRVGSVYRLRKDDLDAFGTVRGR